MPKLLFVLFAALLLSACESISPYGEAHTGAAVYHYESSTDAAGVKKCLVNGTTAKEVPGVTITISDTCELQVEAGGSSPIGDMSAAFRSMAEKMPNMSVIP